MKFGEILHNERIRQNLTAQQMANKIGISVRAYRFYESNSREPNLETLIQIANILNVSTDYLLGRNSDGESADEH